MVYGLRFMFFEDLGFTAYVSGLIVLLCPG